jgi:hypothetical protein
LREVRRLLEEWSELHISEGEIVQSNRI